MKSRFLPQLMVNPYGNIWGDVFICTTPIRPYDRCFVEWPPHKDSKEVFHFVYCLIDHGTPTRDSDAFNIENFKDDPEGDPCLFAVMRVPKQNGDPVGALGYHFGEYGRAWPVEGCAPTYTGDLYRDGVLVERGRHAA